MAGHTFGVKIICTNLQLQNFVIGQGPAGKFPGFPVGQSAPDSRLVVADALTIKTSINFVR